MPQESASPGFRLLPWDVGQRETGLTVADKLRALSTIRLAGTEEPPATPPEKSVDNIHFAVNLRRLATSCSAAQTLGKTVLSWLWRAAQPCMLAVYLLLRVETGTRPQHGPSGGAGTLEFEAQRFGPGRDLAAAYDHAIDFERGLLANLAIEHVIQHRFGGAIQRIAEAAAAAGPEQNAIALAQLDVHFGRNHFFIPILALYHRPRGGARQAAGKSPWLREVPLAAMRNGRSISQAFIFFFEAAPTAKTTCPP
jgi:hypothetical protein